MSAKDAHLYGVPRPKKASAGKDITSGSALAFSTALSSLISSSTTKPSAADNTSTTTTTMAGRTRPSRKKDDIFATHNRNTKKRAAADMLAEAEAQKYSAAKMDDESWRRTKRKMEEKARLYAAMKRGDVEDEAEKHMVDFDRKWAQSEDKAEEDEEEDGEDSEEETEEIIEYVDEFGRTRKGTKAEMAKEMRRRNMVSKAAEEPDRFTARPVAPSNIIFGDTIQAAAFNPDEPTAAQMEEIAKKRDREDTPPPDTHYDANHEIRTRGTGFFQFSKDEEERKRQMEGLEKERVRTEKMREGNEDLRKEERERRKKEVEERRRAILEKRGKVQADRFLDELGEEIMEGAGGDSVGAEDGP